MRQTKWCRSHVWIRQSRDTVALAPVVMPRVCMARLIHERSNSCWKPAQYSICRGRAMQCVFVICLAEKTEWRQAEAECESMCSIWREVAFEKTEKCIRIYISFGCAKTTKRRNVDQKTVQTMQLGLPSVSNTSIEFLCIDFGRWVWWRGRHPTEHGCLLRIPRDTFSSRAGEYASSCLTYPRPRPRLTYLTSRIHKDLYINMHAHLNGGVVG